MEKNSKILPSVRAYFKNGVPRLWRRKVDALLVVTYELYSPLTLTHLHSDKVKSKSKPVINSLGALIDSNSESESDESSDSSSSSASLSVQSPLEKAIKGKARANDVKPRKRASKPTTSKAVAQRKAVKANEYGDEEEISANYTQKSAPKRKRKIQADPLKAKSEKTRWSSAELVALKLAVQHVSPSTPDYWTEIADRVETKSADECQTKHFETIGAIKKTKKSQVKSAQPDKLSRAGTVKRKIQVRKFVKELEERTADDVFASTPVKRSKMDLDGIESPKSNKKIKRAVQYDNKSSEDGSSSENEPIFSPITISKRNDVDSYINQLSKPGKKIVKKKEAKPQPDYRTTMAMETKVGSRALVGTMTPNGTTRVRISHDSDFSDSVDISYDINADSIDDDDEKDDEGSEYSV
ncbi:hypothetical protein THRCLA_10944 [Thraustotheca clavata]|uniref:Myb-like domain-containing protein n=1 Tax=Thraustotheca clavata TaxID=74557 RepID=A0A1V9YCJ8_9STRA|nr:hypothetical protein THRCLA_10944 [Thraustotheca clavata]